MGEDESTMAAAVRAGQVALSRNWKHQSVRATFARSITTSKKNEETATINEKIPSQSVSNADAEAIVTASKKKWASYGFSSKDKEEDVASSHMITFVSITLVFVGGYILYTYGPDRTLRDWAQREAYLTLRQREAAGLPLINKDYVDVASISLPSEEELGDTEIII